MVSRIARQAFLNLLLNALQHTAATGVRGNFVRISVRSDVPGEGSRRFAEIRFADNAWGMHTGDRERVFEMFFTTRKHGSGLGLYVTRLIIESLGGEVTVEETTKFVGTTFLVRLPLTTK
jgi:signal transduction histidine kinase